MTDSHEPAPTSATPPAATPSAAVPSAPAAGTRSTPKFVVGLVLTILGGLLTLVGLARFGANLGAAADGAELAGRVVGGLLIWVVLLVVGIVLLVTSKRR